MIQIKEMTEECIPAIKDCIRKCGPYVQPHPDYNYWLLSHYSSAYTLYAQDEQRVAGFVSSFPMNCRKNEVFVIQICIDADYRGQRIASALLDTLYERHQLNGNFILECTISPENLPSQKTFQQFAMRHGGSWEWKDTFFKGEIPERVLKVEILK